MKKICDFITDSVVSRMQQAFFDAPLALWLFDFYYLNYTLTENPLITSEDLLTKHDGSVFGMQAFQHDISNETRPSSPYSNYRLYSSSSLPSTIYFSIHHYKIRFRSLN